MFEIACLLLTLNGLLCQQPDTDPADLRFQSAIQKARTLVFRLECLDEDGFCNSVCSAVAIDGLGHLVTIGLPSPEPGKLCVKDADGNCHDAQWIGMDGVSGLTLLKTKPELTEHPVIHSGLPVVGSWVIVVGNPFGLSHSVSVGNISGVDRSVRIGGTTERGLIQFSAQIHPGDSGGILADSRGRMLGIVYTALSQPGLRGKTMVPGIGFAIPATHARDVVKKIEEGEPIKRGYLGVLGGTANDGGVEVNHVLDGSPAALSGLLAHDVLLEVNGQAVVGIDHLAKLITRTLPGNNIEVLLRRPRIGEKRVKVVIGRRSDESRGTLPQPWQLAPSIRPFQVELFGGKAESAATVEQLVDKLQLLEAQVRRLQVRLQQLEQPERLNDAQTLKPIR